MKYVLVTPRWTRAAISSFLALTILCAVAFGQQADSSEISVTTTPGKNHPLTITKPPTSFPSNGEAKPDESNPSPTGHNIRFASAVAFNWGATTADVVTTLEGLNTGRCREGNPLFGSRPSAGRVAGISYAYTGGYTLLAWLVHRKHPQSNAPWIGSLILGGGHAVAAGANARCF